MTNRILLLDLLVVTLLWGTGCGGSGHSVASDPWEAAYLQTYAEKDGATRGRDSNPNRRHDLAPDAKSSLAHLISLAEERNPGLRAAYDRWTAAIAEIPQAESLPDPQLSYTYFVEPVETRVGPQRQKFGLSQTVPLFGKRSLRGDLAAHNANASGARFEAARRELHLRVTQLWNDSYLLHQSIAITEENVQLLTHLERVALRQYSSGAAPQSVVLRAQVELGRLEERLRSLEDQKRPLRAALNAELDRPVETDIAWADSIDTRPLPLSIEDLRLLTLNGNPQLRAVSSLVAKEAAASDLAGKNSIPDVTLGAEIIDTGRAEIQGVKDSGKNAVVASVKVNLPLWRSRFGAERSEAEAQHSAALHERLQLENQLLAKLEWAHFELRDAERRAELYAHNLLPRGRQSLEVTENAFITGQATFLDLVDAQRVLLEFQLAEKRALTDRANWRAELEQIVGVDLESGETTP